MKSQFLAIALIAAAPWGVQAMGSSVDPGQGQQERATKSDDELVCSREKKLGSNRMERVCRTVKQLREERERAQADLHRAGRCSGNDSICSGSL